MSPLPSLRIHIRIFSLLALAFILLLEKCVFEHVLAELTLHGYITYSRTCYTYYTIAMIHLHEKKSFPDDRSIVASIVITLKLN